MAQQYSAVPLGDEEDDLFTVDASNSFLSPKIHATGTSTQEGFVPITKPPPKGRDKAYIFLFFLHFLLISLFSILEKENTTVSLIQTGKIGTWTSMIMIGVVLGSFFGALIIFLLSNEETRQFSLSSSLPMAIVIQICLANILFMFGQKLFLLGVVLIVTALWHMTWYRRARESLNFTGAIIQFVGQISNTYGGWLAVICACIVFAQTCVLLGLGVYFVNLLAYASLNYSLLIIVGMVFSIYWTTKVFQGMIAFIVGGCIVWYFVRDDQVAFAPRTRLFFTLQCALTTSFGSLCKGALFASFCDFILLLHLWAEGTGLTIQPNSSFSILGRFCNCRRLIAALIYPFESFSQKNHRLGFCLASVYGKTFSKSGENHMNHYPHTIELALNDASSFNLTCLAVGVAGVVSIIFGMLLLKDNKNYYYSEGTYLALLYFMAYNGVILCVEIYKSAIDAVIVAYALKPDRLANENQIIFLRFLRTSDPSVHT